MTAVAKQNIANRLSRYFEPKGEWQRTGHVSLFALGPMPLLIFLGSQLSNKVSTDLYQRHRDTESWTWKKSGRPVKYTFQTVQTGSDESRVALLLCLSGSGPREMLPSEINPAYFVYELTLDGSTPSPTFLLCGKTWTISGLHTKTPSQRLRRYTEASKNSISSPPFLRQLLSYVAVKLFQRFIRHFECTTTIRHRPYISTDRKFITNRSHGWSSTALRQTLLSVGGGGRRRGGWTPGEGPTSFSRVRKLLMPHGTPAETASLEFPFIGFCYVSLSVSVGSLNAPRHWLESHTVTANSSLFDRTRGKSAYIHIYQDAFRESC